MSNKLSKEELSKLVSQLSDQGISVPQEIETVAGGGSGLCLIGSSEVVKLNYVYGPDDNIFVPNVPKNPEDLFHQNNQTFRGLREAKTKFESAGIDVPEFIEARLLSSPIGLQSKTIYSFQRMTRLYGATLESDDAPYWVPEENAAVNVQLGEVAQIAAKIHVAMGPTHGNVNLDRNFDWTKSRILTSEDQILLTTLGDDMRGHFSANPPRLVWLHNDYSPHNLLKSGERYGVIDWDFCAPGVAEEDLWTLAFHPKHTSEFCQKYNDISSQQPVSEKLVLAYGMNQQTRYFHLFLQDERPAQKFKPEICKLLFDRIKMRVANIAERMHELTGNQVYAEANERFMAAEYIVPLRPVKHPSLPQVREAARAET